MKSDGALISIKASRATEDGLLVKFSDGQYYLFHTSFLAENREKHADRIQKASDWLSRNWQRRQPNADVKIHDLDVNGQPS
jgi:hypothetical protein